MLWTLQLCSHVVTELIKGAETYFDYISAWKHRAPLQPAEPSKQSPVSSATDPNWSGMQSSTFDTYYPSSSLLSRQPLHLFPAVSASMILAEPEEDVSRKRKAPSSGAAAVDSSQSPSPSPLPRSDDNVEADGSDERVRSEVDLLDEVGKGSSNTGSNGNLKKKKKVADKISEVVPASVFESNKRKRKKSAVAQEAEELNSVGRLSVASIAVDDSSHRAEPASASAPVPKGKRTSIARNTAADSEQSVRIAEATPASSHFHCITAKLTLSNEEAEGAEGDAKVGSKVHVTLPPALEALLDFWVRSLHLLKRRLDEAHTWRERAALMMSSIGKPSGPSLKNLSSGVQDWEDRATKLLLAGVQRGVRVTVRGALETHLKHIKAWTASAAEFLSRSSVNGIETTSQDVDGDHGMTYLALQDFVREGEQLHIERPSMIADLKAELRKAKSWLSRYARTAPGSGISAAVPSKEAGLELDALTAEAKQALKVDLREELEIISQATRRYCLCRQLYHGSMVGCDECDEWYHFQCVGLTQFQVEKADKYVCIRCSLKNSFCSTASLAAQITNRWSVPEEAQKAREARRVRVSHFFHSLDACVARASIFTD